MTRLLFTLLTTTVLLVACGPAGDPQAAATHDADAGVPFDSAAVDPVPDSETVVEERGVWLSKNQMLGERDELIALLDALQQANFNAVYINTQLRGFVVYPGSDVLPQWPEMMEHDPEQLTWLIPAIQERGMRAEAWMEYGLYAYWTPSAREDESRGAILDSEPELLSIDADGNEYLHNPNWGDFYALCPTQTRTHELLERLTLEHLERLPFDGINFDRFRFTEADYCFCPACHAAFEEEFGMALRQFDDGTDEAATRDRWRKDQINAMVARISASVRTQFPGKTLTAAVVPPYMLDDKGQDWATWIRNGDVDVVMPMLYLPDVTSEIEATNRFLGERADRVVYGLDAGLGRDVLFGQIEQLREAPGVGFAIWYSGSIEPLLDELGAGLFAEPATSPLGNPTITQ